MRVAFSVGSPLTKEIIDSVSTGSRSPEEILARLDEYNIPWHITDEGDLLIRYWQIVAEDFVPKEHVGRVRGNRTAPPEMDALEWVSKHIEQLKAQHGGQWVGIAENRVVVSAPTLSGLMEALREAGIDGAFITQIPSESIVWRTAYGEQEL